MILCENCITRTRSDQEIGYRGPTVPEPTPPAEERFSELCKAARTLLHGRVEDENVIYPTLALANAIGYDLDLAGLKAQIVSQWDSPAS